MLENYRVKVRTGDFEVEVESSEKAYVDSKLDDLLSMRTTARQPNVVKRPSNNRNRGQRSKNPGRVSQTEKTVARKESNAAVDIPSLISQIKDADDYPELEKNILDGRDMLAKIIACLHCVAAYTSDAYLTTGQIETITDQLGIKVGMANAANKIRDNQKYFTGKTVRKKGQAVPYKLNRRGEQAFSKYLKGEKP